MALTIITCLSLFLTCFFIIMIKHDLNRMMNKVEKLELELDGYKLAAKLDRLIRQIKEVAKEIK